MKTLTPTANNKMAQRFLDSLDHITYMHQGEEKTNDILQKNIDGNRVEVLIYFTAEVEGTISEVKVIDIDGDAIIAPERIYNQEESDYPRGLYISFEYIFEEQSITTLNDGEVL